MKPIRFYLLTISCFFCSTLIGQNFQHYGLEEGLSQESVQSILRDKQGFLWLGTQDGLNRFDGDRFETFKNNPGDSASISDNYITHLWQDKSNLIWVGTGNKGLNYYDPSIDRFFRVGPQRANCTGLTEDDNGAIFASYLDQGLFKFQSEKQESIPFFNSQKLHITSLSYSNKKLWIGTKKGRLFWSFTQNDLSFKEVILKKTDHTITTIFIHDHNVFIGTNAGLFLYNTQSGFVKEIFLVVDDSTISKKLVIEKITSKNDQLFVATDNGLFVLKSLNDSTQKFIIKKRYQGDRNSLNSLTSNRVYDVLIEDDQLWIGTNKLDILQLRDPIFKTINTSTTISLFNNHVYAILKTKEYLFVGTRGGLNCIDNNGNTSLISTETVGSNLAYNVIRGMAVDSENNLWLATTKGVSVIGLDNFDPKRPIIQSTYHNENASNSLSNNKTRSIFLDKKNTIWVTTYGGGINRFAGNVIEGNFTFVRYQHQKGVNSLSSDFNFNMTQDENGIYWIASENGLNSITFRDNNFEKPLFKSYFHEPGNSKSLASNSTLYTLQDSKEQMWIATENGIHKYNKDQDSFTHYGKKHGLTNTFVYSILEGNDGLYWITTNDGIFSFNPKTERFTNFNTNDGVQSTEFNLGAQFKDKDFLYFGGIKGLNVFNPFQVKALDKETSLVFSSLYVKDKKINSSTNDYMLHKSISLAKEINLNHNDFPAYITFSPLDFRASKNNTFQYKLLPNDTEWNDLGDRKEIQLLNLSKGEYILEVQGKTRYGQWKKQPLQITINVTPPWYRSSIAFIVYGLLILVCLYWLYRFQLGRKIDAQEASRLRELNNLKSKLYTNITHEFRTPITVILGMAKNLKEHIPNTTNDISDSLNLIENNSHNLLHLVNQMLDLAKAKQGKLNLNFCQENIVDHTRYLTESFMFFAKEKENQLVFYNEEDTIIMDIDIEKYTQIVTNLISNAIKFSEKGKIVVHTSQKNNVFELKIKDTGCGISEEDLPFVFDRFYQIQKNKTENEGTGIGLALSRELVELMKGSITVKSKLKQGTTFIVKIPITKRSQLATSTSFTPITNKKTEIPIPIPDTEAELPLILVVEDNQDVTKYIISCLKENYQVKHAENGETGIKMAIEIIPDIIISDIMMPKKDGFELCEIIKENTITNHIPVILLTAKATQNDKIIGLELGADTYLTKPFSKKELLVRIQQLIKLRKTLQEKYLHTENLSTIHTLKETPKTKDDLFIDSIIANIHTNIENSKYTALYLSRDMNLSESQLYRKLKAITNTSTAVFIRKIRLAKARDLLLQNNDLTVAEICYATGFNDPSWFSKAYKNEYGHAPSNSKIT
jgi:signal transduction histidine kinase/ligand-binding sensor domain-containing protein/DNA-binding response OmpR family regulator